MAAHLTSKNTGMLSDTETVTITRQVATSTHGQYTTSTIYSGPGDLQEEGGSTYVNPAGVVDQTDAILYIDPDSNGNLPVVEAMDAVTGLGKTFNVVQVSTYNFVPAHLEIGLKRGPVQYRGKR